MSAVPKRGLEPPPLTGHAPEACASTNSATRAHGNYTMDDRLSLTCGAKVRILAAMHFRVGVRGSKNGYTLAVNGKSYPVSYPSNVWQAFPRELHVQFAQTMAFIATMHLSFPNKNTVSYAFPTPAGETFFSYGLLFAMTENLLEYDRPKTTDYLRILMNSFYRRRFTGHAPSSPVLSVGYTPKKNTALIPFSFGKDSLLTLGLSGDLGIKAIPVFFLEPGNTLENKNKHALIAEFKAREGIDVTTVPVALAPLRQERGFSWGWDNFLTHYTLSLIPYLYAHKAQYLFWSNEYNREITAQDPEGFVAHHTFEQSARWLAIVERALRSFGVPVEVASIIERLPELSVLGVLHRRYPRLAAYQLSCLNDAPQTAAKRWCGVCYECAKVYVYFSALGIDPRTVLLNDNMLSARNKKHFYIFSPKDFHNAFSFNQEEHLYVFWKSWKRGVRAPLIAKFYKKYAGVAKKNEDAWRRRYLSVYPPQTTPTILQKPLEKLLLTEVSLLRASMR